MNPFIASSLRMLKLHGVPCLYSSVSEPVYNIETGRVTSSTANIAVTLIPKPIKVNQYNYPNLVDKEVVMFYLVNHDLSFVPKANDTVTHDGERFMVNQMIKHYARGQLVLYKLVCVKG